MRRPQAILTALAITLTWCSSKKDAPSGASDAASDDDAPSDGPEATDVCDGAFGLECAAMGALCYPG